MEIHQNLPVRLEDPLNIYTSFTRVRTLTSIRDGIKKYRCARSKHYKIE